MVLSGLVNAKYQFMLVDFGTNRRISDGSVLRNTTFFEKLLNEELNIPCADNIGGSSKQFPYVFVCDDTFPLRTNMLNPFRHPHLDRCEKKKIKFMVEPCTSHRGKCVRNIGKSCIPRSN